MSEIRYKVLAAHPDNPASDLIEELYEIVVDEGLRYVIAVDDEFIHSIRTGLVFSSEPISQTDANNLYSDYEGEMGLI